MKTPSSLTSRVSTSWVTSPPYVGLIDYHEQHRYAYELLGLPFKREHEIGAAFKGTSKVARRNYCEEIRQVLMNLKPRLNKNGRFVIVVNDRDNSMTTCRRSVASLSKSA